MWQICILVCCSQSLTYIFGLVLSWIKKISFEVSLLSLWPWIQLICKDEDISHIFHFQAYWRATVPPVKAINPIGSLSSKVTSSKPDPNSSPSLRRGETLPTIADNGRVVGSKVGTPLGSAQASGSVHGSAHGPGDDPMLCFDLTHKLPPFSLCGFIIIFP